MQIYIVLYDVNGKIMGVDRVFTNRDKAKQYCEIKNNELFDAGYLYWCCEKSLDSASGEIDS